MGADGGHFLIPRQFRLELDDEAIVDGFAGGGGASEAIEQAFQRHVDIAMNHDDDALSMHRVNHPQTQHFIKDIRDNDPREVSRGRRIGLAHFSPDCTDHSQANGGQPRDKEIRSLAWVAVRWAGQVQPRAISLENVKQILKWAPLVAKRCPDTGRVVTLDKVACPRTGKMVNRIADRGERVPVQRQYLVADKKREGKIWRRFAQILLKQGYTESGVYILNAANYGAGTTRERLFGLWRRDGVPVKPPVQTHYKNPKKGQKRWRSAAEFIDWSIPCLSIFATKAEAKEFAKRHGVGVPKRPLEQSSLARVASGVFRYVLNHGDPFIVPATHQGSVRTNSIRDPLPTITGANRGELMLAVPHFQQITQSGRIHDPRKPLPTITTAKGGEQMMVAAFLAQHNTQKKGAHPGHDARNPLSTIIGTGSHQNVVTAHLAHFRGNCDARSVADPLHTISAGGEHHALIECTLSSEQQEGALRVAAFLMKYHANGGQWGDLRDPAPTVTAADTLALVTVTVRGTPMVIVDIALRMFDPEELKLCQGFPPDYVISHGHDGRVFSKSKRVHCIGNSVSPLPYMALLEANFPRASGPKSPRRRGVAA